MVVVENVVEVDVKVEVMAVVDFEEEAVVLD